MPQNKLTLYNLTRDTVLARQVKIADRFFSRLRGLMFRPPLPPGEALWLRPCKGVHMFFMRFPLDVVFVDRNLQVVHLVENLQPWRVSPIVREADSALELPAGSIQGKVSVGDKLYVGPLSDIEQPSSP